MTIETLSGQPLSAFCFGAMQFGENADEAESAAMYGACREAGINFFDTAYVYTDGASEVILGGLLAEERDDIFLATKCASGRTATPDVIEAEFDESRKRLGQETVDLLYIHQWDPITPLEVSFGKIAAYVEAGAVRYVGVSNFSAWQTMKALQVAGDLGIELKFLQPMYNLVKRQAEVEILPMAISEGLCVAPYSPLGDGLRTGKYADGGGGRIESDPMYAKRYAPAWMHTAAGNLAALAAVEGAYPATLAVAWVARHAGVTAPIISARSVEQLRPSLTAMNFGMDDALFDKISTLTPKPPPAHDRLEEG